MEDKELLELAARAAGMTTDSFSLGEDWYPIFDGVEGFYLAWGTGWWNPLIDDGDSLRLAVKLGLVIQPKGMGVEVWSFDARKSSGVVAYIGDPYAATRRAIVRAAAEMGKSMG